MRAKKRDRGKGEVSERDHTLSKHIAATFIVHVYTVCAHFLMS